MSTRKSLKRSVMMLVWRIFNPPSRLLAGIAPWWVLLEVGRQLALVAPVDPIVTFLAFRSSSVRTSAVCQT